MDKYNTYGGNIKMTSQELYKIVHGELFKTRSCVPNVWVKVEVTPTITIEAMQPSKGNIRIRKIKEMNGLGQVLTYSIYKFNNKKELIFETYDYQIDTWEETRKAQRAL